MVFTSHVFVTVVLAHLTGANAFNTPLFATTTTNVNRNSNSAFIGKGKKISLSMSDQGEGEKSKDTFVEVLKSSKKEIGYDEKSGRFFETDAEECIPEDEYCVVDNKTGNLIRLTVEEKERIFLDALQSYYVSGRQLLNDEEFDLLKSDLQWNGSPVVVLNRNEAKYLAALQAYLKGEPILSDEEFDSLKSQLKEEGSQFAVSKEPKCYIDTGICTVTLEEDFFRGNLLYLPAGLLLSIVWLGFGFEIIEPLIRINPLLLLGLGSPLIYNGSKFITEELIFVNNKIVVGPCPSCENRNRIYFGNILGVEGFKDVAEIKCPNCKEVYRVQRKTLRASTLPKS